MNILIITKYNNDFGVVAHVINLANELTKHGDNVYVMAPLLKDCSKGTYSRLEKATFIEMDSNILSNLRIVKKVCKKYRIDVIHSHNRSTSILAQYIQTVLGIPFVWTMHLNNIPCDFLHRMMTFPGKKVIAVSSELKDFGVGRLKIDRDKFTVISNGINEQAYFRMGGITSELKSKWNIKQDEKVITIFSRLEKVKGHATILEALKAFDQFSYKLLITGNDADDGSYRKELKELIHSYKLDEHIEFVGFVDANQILNISNLMVLPSENEGQAITILESFILRVPVIRTKTGGYEDMRDYCVGIDVGDSEMLRYYISDILTYPEKYSKMIDAAESYVKSSCTTAVMGKSVREVYESVLSEK